MNDNLLNALRIKIRRAKELRHVRPTNALVVLRTVLLGHSYEIVSLADPNVFDKLVALNV